MLLDNIKIIHSSKITKSVYDLFIHCCIIPDENLECILLAGIEKESIPHAKEILSQLVDNIHIAKEKNMPLCQDTGMAVVFIDIGQDVHISGDYISDAINQGVIKAYEDGYFRKSVLSALERKNTKNNSPAIIHTRIVKGNNIKISVAPKGFGSENMSRIKMITPGDGIEGVKKFIVETVSIAGANPCPPISLGVGIGGTFELAALNAKRALLRPLGKSSTAENLAMLEKELLDKINELGIGPMGLGGQTTALAVNIIEHPTHLAGLPVAVNVQCHCVRHSSTTISE